MKPVVFYAGCILALGGLTWGLTYHELIFTSFFAPKFENVRRQTFEQSKSFRDGSIQELQNMQFEYIKADPAHKKALADVIRHRATEIPADALPQDLYNFIQGLKYN